jgi:hypothetical protein
MLHGKPHSSVSRFLAQKKELRLYWPVLPFVQEYAILEPERRDSHSHEELQKKGG